ncbi:MAG: hypothetical protein ACJAWL_000969 [Motiliproteus sp.]|jgi:hypothetical protein
MKKTLNNTLITAFIGSFLISGAALADDDCSDPVSEWQPREQLRQKMHDRGWDVKRIKVDDGCYEVRGYDRRGHRVEAKFSPASLRIVELEIKFNDSDDASDYLEPGSREDYQKSDASINSGSQPLKNKPRVNIQ